MNLFDVLKFEEGYREQPYYCSENYPTIGIGTKIGTKNAPLKYFDFTVSERVAKVLLEEETESNIERLRLLPWFVSLEADRKVIIESMCYQLGYTGVMKFKKMIAAIEVSDFNEAAVQMLDSRWAKQTSKRANRHAQVMRCGSLFTIYGGLI